jgi:predicted phosphohydrolase
LNPSGLIVTGDISHAKALVLHLSAIERLIQKPIYFILGNHDFWGSDVASVRKQMHEVSNMSQFLKYVPLNSYSVLTPNTAIVGHDCWYDAQFGNPKGSRFFMNDWFNMRDYAKHSGGQSFYNATSDVKDRAGIISVSQHLAKEGVQHIHDGIKAAVRYSRNIIVMSHVPPFQEAHVHEGAVGDAGSQPWFTCKMLGDMLLAAAKAYPTHNFTSLSGHTHGQYVGQVLPNLRVTVAGAEYGQPRIASIVDVA